MNPECADNQRNGFLVDFRILLPGPEALNIEFLECPAREFEPAFTDFLIGRVHGNDLTQSQAATQASLPASLRYYFPMPNDASKFFDLAEDCEYRTPRAIFARFG